MIQVIICGPSSTAFSFFSSIPFFRLLPPPRIALLPGTRHRLSSTTTSLPPTPTLFHEVFACSTRSQRTHTHAFSRHFLLSPPPPGRITSAGSIFSNGWTSSHVHSPVTTGPCSLIKNNRQATRELFLVVAIRSTVLFLVSNRWRPNC